MGDLQKRLDAAPDVLEAVTVANNRPDSELLRRPRRSARRARETPTPPGDGDQAG